jgi:glycerophosphoryl diester phosphodiesterase
MMSQNVAGPRLRLFGCLLSIVLLGQSFLCAQTPTIIAHRGASHDAPENTLAAFRLAWEQGADGIEGDFYLSKDGQIVCMHDKTTKRTADKDLTVAEATLEELRQLDVGSWKSPQFAGERIPTLAEVLAIVPEDKLIYVEIKCGPEIVPYLPPVFKASGLSAKQIRIIAFDENVIAAVKQQLPEIKAFWLTSYKQNKATGKWKPTPAEVRKTLREVKADGLGTKAETQVVDQKFAQELRAGGWEFHTWTIDEIPLARQFMEWGVDSITTNRPAFLRKNLERAVINRVP